MDFAVHVEQFLGKWTENDDTIQLWCRTKSKSLISM